MSSRIYDHSICKVVIWMNESVNDKLWDNWHIIPMANIDMIVVMVLLNKSPGQRIKNNAAITLIRRQICRWMQSGRNHLPSHRWFFFGYKRLKRKTLEKFFELGEEIKNYNQFQVLDQSGIRDQNKWNETSIHKTSTIYLLVNSSIAHSATKSASFSMLNATSLTW